MLRILPVERTLLAGGSLVAGQRLHVDDLQVRGMGDLENEVIVVLHLDAVIEHVLRRHGVILCAQKLDQVEVGTVVPTHGIEPCGIGRHWIPFPMDADREALAPQLDRPSEHRANI